MKFKGPTWAISQRFGRVAVGAIIFSKEGLGQGGLSVGVGV